MKKFLNYFSKAEKILWCVSTAVIIAVFCVFDRHNFLNLISSLIGVTSLIFIAKGNPIGQILIIIFAVFYGIVSFWFSYYGETITYLGMSMPMAVIALISWLKNPYNGNKAEVKVNKITRKDICILVPAATVVTVAFYFILAAFKTANLTVSTFSVTTSFVAVFLTARRSPYYALAYAVNDVVLITLWSMAAAKDISYLSVVICFVAFFANDIYGFINWKRIKKRQNSEQKEDDVIG